MSRTALRPLVTIAALLGALLGQPFAHGVAAAAEPVHGLKGEYFRMSAPGARDFAVPGGESLEPQVNFTDLRPTFTALTGQGDHVTARWTGTLAAPATGDYTFYAVGDNGFRLFVDGAAVIDHWVPDWDVEQTSAPVTLTAGVEHEFRLEMFQDVGGANMFLRWSSATIAKTLVPQSAFTALPAPAAATHGLRGEYFQMSAPGARDFAQPGGVTFDPTINFSDLNPRFQSMTGRTVDTTARWTGQLDVPVSGAYTFFAVGDNGFRLFVDDVAVINHWEDDWDVEQTSAPITLAAGVPHSFRLEYFQNAGGANMFLRWSSAAIAKQIVPTTAFTPPALPAAAAHGLRGDYYRMSAPGARDFASLGMSGLDPNVDFPNLVSTFEAATGQGEHTTARWTGQIQAPADGAYTFYAIGDNGFRLLINGVAVIDHWEGDWDVEQASVPVTLAAGVEYDFRLEMFQDVGGASMFLRWSSVAMAKTIVPESAFTPPAGFEIFPVELTLAADGVHLEANFDQPITDIGTAAAHLVIQADTTPMPIQSVALKPGDPSTLVVTLTRSVFKGMRVRFAYDGDGGLRVDGEAVPQIVRNAVNLSTQRMMTEWGAKLNKAKPLPEYPRPQLVRPHWMNLNGPWEFAGADEGEKPAFGTTLGERIIVPFPVESQLSGLERHEDHMFYRRLVEVPAGWSIGSARRLQLNFGAVDYHATVYVNGTKVTEHKGGYTAFTADITDALKPSGPQEIIVAVTDTTDGAHQSIGKQNRTPGGIVYTASSGIWQTVWMEPVPTKAIDHLVLTPDISTSSLAVTVKSTTATPGAIVKLQAYDRDGKNAGTIEGQVNTKIALPVKKQHLWTPDDPYLYQLTVELKDGNVRDPVRSYFGMRSVAIQEVGGYQKIVLNGKPIFSLAMLDQGFWPDGLYTAPSDAALRWDLQAQKDLGFNAVRKHIKVEPARWYAHADQIGLLVWQDFVSGDHVTAEDKQVFMDQNYEMMDELNTFPSIIGWVVFNEGWGEWDRTVTGRLAGDVKAADPSRLVNVHSGVNCCSSKGDSGKGEIIDHHDYNNTEPPTPDHRAAMDGEHGGFTLRTPGHMWPGPPLAIYSGVETSAALTKRYVDNTETFYLAQAGAELSGSVYTQVTDLEHEINGMWTYDRKVLKVDLAAVRAINLKVVAAGANAGTPVVYPGTGCWSLNENGGTSGADGCGPSPLSTTGNPAWVPGVSGSALDFSGAGQYAETAAPVVDTTKDYSISAWARMDALPDNYGTVVSQDGRATANPFYLQYGQGGWAFSLPGDVRAKLTTAPELGRWYHLVGVREQASNELRLYLDGALVATTVGGVDGVSSGPLTVGRAKYAGTKGDFWNGAIDEVRAYDRVLTATEIAALHTSG